MRPSPLRAAASPSLEVGTEMGLDTSLLAGRHHLVSPQGMYPKMRAAPVVWNGPHSCHQHARNDEQELEQHKNWQSLQRHKLGIKERGSLLIEVVSTKLTDNDRPVQFAR